MANIKQQKKRNKTNEKHRLRNTSFKSSVKTIIKKFKKYVIARDKKEAVIYLSLIHKKLDKGLAKGIFNSNYVARHKSSFAKLNNKIELDK